MSNQRALLNTIIDERRRDLRLTGRRPVTAPPQQLIPYQRPPFAPGPRVDFAEVFLAYPAWFQQPRLSNEEYYVQADSNPKVGRDWAYSEQAHGNNYAPFLTGIGDPAPEPISTEASQPQMNYVATANSALTMDPASYGGLSDPTLYAQPTLP
jgi:hypothetical protein